MILVVLPGPIKQEWMEWRSKRQSGANRYIVIGNTLEEMCLKGPTPEWL
jgi:hypothetical protein